MANVVYVDLPTTVRGFVRYNPDGTYTIVINSRMSAEQQRKTWIHEMRHIECDDFSSSEADEIERRRH
jgi:acylphosphatase